MQLSTIVFPISCVLLSLFQPSLSQLNACGHPIPNDAVPTATCTGCNTIKVCMGATGFTEGACDSSLYCNELPNNAATCSEIPPAGCEPDSITEPPLPGPDGDPEEGAILCTGVGIYPDATDCNVYHYCPARDVFSWVQVCPPGYAFAYTSSAASDRFPCKQIKTTEKDCVKITCTSSDILKSYGTSKIFYGQCSGEGQVAMMRCSDGATFNGAECVFKCVKEGLYPNTVDPSQYYQCYFAGRTLVVREKNCPGDRKFDRSLMVCV